MVKIVDALAKDAYAALAHLDGRVLEPGVVQAAALLATVVGQDLETTEDGTFRIARKVAKDRVISTVDPEARHGHKTAARGFDGYKGHLALDPESEIVTATEVTPGNVGDAAPATELLAGILGDDPAEAGPTEPESGDKSRQGPAEVYGDASYGTADIVERLEAAGVEANVKVQPPVNREGRFTQDAFQIDTEAGQVQCPNGVLVVLRLHKDGYRHADFGAQCTECPLRTACTTSKTGRTIIVHPKHETLKEARTRQRDAAWKKRYRATRPKVERKIAHLMRRKHGGRRARVRGCVRIGHDFALLAAAVNLQRIAVLTARSEQAQARA